jgi:CO/xanthine dehydrogenase FAD-binding subunit
MTLLKEYYRPQTLDEALALLRRDAATVPLGGGTHLVPALTTSAVVDLQALGLDELVIDGPRVNFGAMVRLQRLVKPARDQVGDFVAEAARREGPRTYRNAATIGGTIAIGDPSSCLLIALLALDAEVQLRLPDPATVSLDRLLDNPHKFLGGGLITSVTALSAAGVPGLAMEVVARTPRDKPIVAAAVRVAPAGELCGDVRIALAGVADRPVRAYEAEERLKGQPFEKGLVDKAVAAALAGLYVPSDFKGSHEYRRSMAATLAWRALQEACDKLKNG